VLGLTLMMATPVRADDAQGPRARSATSEFARAMSRERAVLALNGNARIGELANGVRPLAREGVADGEEVTVATRSISPEASGGVQRLDLASLDRMPPAQGDAQWQCLAQAIYHESRGEPLAGQIAVAEVVLNRVDSPRYPSSVCGVTRQGAGSGRGCQFSYACDGRSDAMASATSRLRAEKLARLMLDGHPRSVTDGALFFHATYVAPSWSRTMTRTAAIGNHRFYRPATRVAQR
jgi:spore germination cell wall hydrolase CwlJ-like protein